MGYDFSQLNDKEFEILSFDLLSIDYDARIERFKDGKDRGIDGRFFIDSGKEVCLQCKHYLKTGYRGLISKLKKEESKKVKKINPGKYIFVTSLPLSRDNKAEIKKIFHPYIKRSSDIFGQEDLNDLLTKYPKVEENHFKLWISNTTVFNRIINNAIKGRSEFELEQIKNNSFKYIKTDSHDKALEILNEKNVLLISGEPGIGKTTLANNLCLYFASKDYEFIDIEESLSEAENIYTRSKKQIFYFDDFLGSNYFEVIENKKDSHIMKFIERIKNDKSKRFILTSRTNILNSGILYSSTFAIKKIQNNEFMLTIKDLTDFDRARILYNHIWFSELTEEYIDEYYKDKRYKDIISHRNFNPRLIEFITDNERLNVSSSTDYWRYILKTLNNPKDIWDNCFKIQNNAHVRNLVKLTVFNGGSIKESELQNSFYRLNEIEKLRNTSHAEKDFKSTSRLSSKSLLNRNKFTSGVTYTLFNPSIADYVLNEYCNDYDTLAKIFKTLNTVKSLEHLLAMEREKIISQEHIQKLKNILFDDAYMQNKNIDYLIYISYLFIDDDSKNYIIHDLLIKISQQPMPIGELYKFLNLLTLHHDQLNISGYGFLLECINDRNLDELEINHLAEFLEELEIYDEDILDKLKVDLEQHLFVEVTSKAEYIDISPYITFFEGHDGDEDIHSDEEGIERELFSIIDSLLKEFYSDLIRDLNVDYNEILSAINIDEMVTDHISSQMHIDEEESGRYVNISDDRIDDLFERT